MKIFKVMMILVLTVASEQLQSGAFLWEYRNGADRSCCLCIAGADICNPNVPCTRHLYTDLTGILDYINRLLSTEKGSTFSYNTLLQQAQIYINHVLYSRISLSYRFDRYQQHPVKFLHEIEVSKSEKSGKTSTTTTATTDKAKDAEKMIKYLASLGLIRPLK
ncbi:MAG TPA: hypothetical protein VLG50_02330 [Candidatus Saccharimonadales bacterium]|nr:hypothetical protein [Candidatus Saccharimonadales bacterium]